MAAAGPEKPRRADWFSQTGPFSPPSACGALQGLPLTLRMIAPSTRRSRKAIAKGPSERYSPHLSKSTLVTSAVERLVSRGDDLVKQVGRLRTFVALNPVEPACDAVRLRRASANRRPHVQRAAGVHRSHGVVFSNTAMSFAGPPSAISGLPSPLKSPIASGYESARDTAAGGRSPASEPRFSD